MKYFLFVFCWLVIVTGYAQTNISGVINDYAAVTNINISACQTNEMTVDTASFFAVGDTVLVIQMQGAVIDVSNTANYGDIVNYGSAGLFEKNVISAINGNTLSFQRQFVNAYSANGSVQVVSIPYYNGNVNINAVLTAKPWNGTKGGILIFNAGGNVFVNNLVDVNGLGFRGGTNVLTPPYNCNAFTSFGDYVYPTGSFNSTEKGEGIVTFLPNQTFGRGKQANGGGGGNDHNAGGGGGANAAAGGVGAANNEPSFFGCRGAFPGVGGAALDYASNTRVFMGGGGGAGHGNNTNNYQAGNGGGIVMIEANEIICNPGGAFEIRGETVVTPGDNDGGAGGGGAGALLLLTNNAVGNLTVWANGGNGANTQNYTNSGARCFGPGGGGSGGVLITNMPLTGSNNLNFTGGMAGIITQSTQPCNGTSGGALNGSNGVQINNWPNTIPLSANNFVSNTSTVFLDTIVACDSVLFNGNYVYADSVYNDTILSNASCDSIVQITITVNQSSNSTLNETIYQGDSVVVGSSVYYNAGSYTDTLIANGCDSIVNLNLTVLPARTCYTERIVTYNVLNYPGTTGDVRDPYFRMIIDSLNPDILVLQEINNTAGAIRFRDSVMAFVDSDYAMGTFIDGSNTNPSLSDNLLFYRQSKFTFLSNGPLSLGNRDINQFTLVHNETCERILLYAMHLKSGTSNADENQRLLNMQSLRNLTNTFPDTANFMFLGDFNAYSNTEPAYLAAINPLPNNRGYVTDPLNLPGTWNDSIYAIHHTQSTRTRQFGGGANSGLDDRLDMILFSEAIAQDWLNIGFTGTYFAFGNDGNHYNDSINAPTNTAVSQAMANALHYASDHLPVVAEFSFCGSIDTILIDTLVCNRANYVSPTGNAFNASGIYFDSNVCDTVYRINLTLSNSDTTFIQDSTCNSALAGMDTAIVVRTNECDSVVITNTVLLTSDTVFLQDTTCNANLVGLDTVLISRPNLCDSLVITNTILFGFDTSFVQNTTCNMAMVGLDTVNIARLNQCDSVVITNTILSGFDTTFIQNNTCDTALVGVDTVNVPRPGQCDSLLITNTVLLPFTVVQITDSNCIETPGIYYDTLTTALGCDSIVERVVLKRDDCFDDCGIEVPTAFSPNNDGNNDVFLIFTNCENGFSFFEVSVYNRWGELVFKSNDARFNWIGSYKGQALPTGNYSYYIRYAPMGVNEQNLIKGNLTLIR